MSGEPMDYFRKYTTLITGTFYSDAFDVAGYKTIAAETYYAAGTSGGTVTAQMEQSSDLIVWSNFGSAMTPAAAASDTESASDPARWVRLKITIGGGSDKVITLWAKGVARDA